MKDICHIMAVCVILNNIAPFDEVKSVGSFYTVLIRWLPFIYFKFLQSTFFKTKLHGVGVPEHGGQRPRRPSSGVRIPAVACVLSTSAFFLFTGQRILLFRPRQPGGVHFSLFLVYWAKNSAF